MTDITTLCVFCGSRMGNDPAYAEAARALGAEMARRGIRLVYGGGGIGLMANVAHAVLEGGGNVTGIIPEFLLKMEVGNLDGVDTEVVDSMHERKARMFTLADAFVVLPGGLGTLDETFEIATWKQLGQHTKPIVVLDTAGCWTPMKGLIESIIDRGFAHGRILDLVSFVDDVDAVFAAIDAAPEPGAESLRVHLERL